MTLPMDPSSPIRTRTVTRRVTATPSLALIAAVTAITFVTMPAIARGQTASGPPTTESPATDPVFQSWRNQEAVAACGRCHYNGANDFTGAEAALFSRLDELRFWLQNDKHAIARRRVEPLNKDQALAQAELISEKLGMDTPADWLGPSNVLSKRICDKLGYEVSGAVGYRQFQENCLTCHGGYQATSSNDVRQGFGMPQPLDPLASQPGISCNYCHQLGENKAWIDLHGTPSAPKDWRTKTPVEKAAAGMRDLVDTFTQASLCFDCHVGNRKTNQFVTHEMYAAGHPPLPSVELETFCEQMPRHWQSSSELHNALAKSPTREKYFAVNFPKLFSQGATIDAGKMFWNTRNLLVGSLVARVKSIELYEDSGGDDQWADYSLYDCAACHHELREPSARQQRGYPGAPGRPRQPEWHASVLTTALRFSSPDVTRRVHEREAILDAEFGRRPFGDPRTLIPVAKTIKNELIGAIEIAQSKPIDASIARKVLISLAQTPDEQLLTYDAARQLAWAMILVADELEQEGSPLPGDVRMAIDSLSQPEIAPGRTGIETKLPAGRQVFIYPDNLQLDLERRAAYDPKEFVPRLRSVGSKLVIVSRSQTLTAK